jgi:hypothetical protein
MNKQAQIDVPVLFIFFARPEQTSLVFEEIRNARPTKLYLYQDGARENRPDDIDNIIKCRNIVEEIDWECEINRFYQDKNVGCDPSEFIAQKWMFSMEDRGIILEDDDVPSQSFFPFCKELLDKYADDERINMICGMNNLEITDSPYSYLFTNYGSIWGWATWKRNVDRWDDKLSILDDKQLINGLLEKIFPKHITKVILEKLQIHKDSGVAFYESILGIHQYTNNQLNIVPCKNLISNIGLGIETTHAANSINKIPRAIRKLFFMKRYTIDFPLNHPRDAIEDMNYKSKFESLVFPNNFVSQTRRLEGLLYRKLPFLGKL